MAPVVGRIKWTEEVQCRLVTFSNPTGDITNSDLELSAEVLGWLVFEGVVPTRWIHEGVYSDNYATASWQTQSESQRLRVENRFLRILTIRLRKNRASPLVTRHLAGDRNALGDTPSRSYGYKTAWHLRNATDFWTF